LATQRLTATVDEWRMIAMAKVIPLKEATRTKKFPERGTARRSRRTFAIVCVLAISALIVIWAFLPKLPDSRSVVTIGNGEIRVIDGDTVTMKGKNYRLVGFDTPEISRAKCDGERARGVQAAVRLRSLISSGVITLQEVRCSCPPGTAGTSYCNFGRLCVMLQHNGENVGDILIRERLARPLNCGQFRCPKRLGWC
jgi:endonuclease YncB( thermonuclease family)